MPPTFFPPPIWNALCVNILFASTPYLEHVMCQHHIYLNTLFGTLAERRMYPAIFTGTPACSEPPQHQAPAPATPLPAAPEPHGTLPSSRARRLLLQEVGFTANSRCDREVSEAPGLLSRGSGLPSYRSFFHVPPAWRNMDQDETLCPRVTVLGLCSFCPWHPSCPPLPQCERAFSRGQQVLAGGSWENINWLKKREILRKK